MKWLQKLGHTIAGRKLAPVRPSPPFPFVETVGLTTIAVSGFYSIYCLIGKLNNGIRTYYTSPKVAKEESKREVDMCKAYIERSSKDVNQP